jgi:hypothetical protein
MGATGAMRTLRTIVAGAVALPLTLGLGGVAFAQAASTPAAKPDPDALAALYKMGDALRSMGAFSLSADVTTDTVLESGQKLQTEGTLKIEALRPDKFKISVDTNHQAREFYYDGKSLTLFAPKVGYYASVPAPPTIRATLEAAKDKYGIEIPLADLFSLGTDPSLVARIKEGFDAGPDVVAGKNCQHYAFRQEAVDWEVWIRSEGPALPCKIVITTVTDPAMPQYAATMKWQGGSPTADTFTFTPPANAHRITVADRSAPAKK